MPTAQHADTQEAALQAFLAPLPKEAGLRLRSLAHAWVAAGGSVQPGKISCRLQAGSPAYTAGTLFANQAGHPSLELARIQLQARGIDDATWQAWCDEHVALREHGFEPTAKYTTVRLDAMSAADLMRLVEGLRDLGLALHRK